MTIKCGDNYYYSATGGKIQNYDKRAEKAKKKNRSGDYCFTLKPRIDRRAQFNVNKCQGLYKIANILPNNK